MSDDYLWNPSGEPDPEIERLERLLSRFRHNRPAPEFPEAKPERRRFWMFPRLLPLAAAAAVVLVAAGGWYVYRATRPAWEVARLDGTPRIGSKQVKSIGRLVVGESLETDGASRATVKVGLIGEVEIDPNTRIRLLQARQTEQRMALDHGTMRAQIWAPPRLFFVNTPSAVAVDLGCRYTLSVDRAGFGLLHVTYGWVAFEDQGRESFVPAGAMCATRPATGPGTPYFADASEELRAALARFDAAAPSGGVSGGVAGGVAGGVTGGVQGGVSGGVQGGVEAPEKLRAVALETVLAEARPRDALTLWHLLARATDFERPRVYDRLAQLVPPPPSVTREGILRGDPSMRDLWWDALGLGDTSWWRLWKGPVPVR